MQLILDVAIDGEWWGPGFGKVNPPPEVAARIENPDAWSDTPAPARVDRRRQGVVVTGQEKRDALVTVTSGAPVSIDPPPDHTVTAEPPAEVAPVPAEVAPQADQAPAAVDEHVDPLAIPTDSTASEVLEWVHGGDDIKADPVDGWQQRALVALAAERRRQRQRAKVVDTLEAALSEAEHADNG